MTIRKATTDDVKIIASLSALKRKQYENYQPQFHKEAEGAVELQTVFLKDFLSKENVIALIYGDGAQKINGFIIGAVVNSPPVYNPGGKVCFVDDFMVSDPSLTRPPQPGPVEKSYFSIMGQEKGGIYAKEETQRRADHFHVAPGRG